MTKITATTIKMIIFFIYSRSSLSFRHHGLIKPSFCPDYAVRITIQIQRERERERHLSKTVRYEWLHPLDTQEGLSLLFIFSTRGSSSFFVNLFSAPAYAWLEHHKQTQTVGWTSTEAEQPHWIALFSFTTLYSPPSFSSICTNDCRTECIKDWD